MNQQETEKVSIIIPVYKVEPYLRKCVDSVLAQTYKNLEIILVDDGSPDECPKICDEYKERDSRIKVIHKENGGLSDARNFGLAATTGDYILFVDSDDWIAENAVERSLAVLHEENADISMFNLEYVYEDGSKELVYKGENEIIDLCGKAFWDFYYCEDAVVCAVAVNKLMKREILKDFSFATGRIHEDEFMCNDLSLLNKKIVFFNEALYFYYKRSGSIMSTPNIKGELDTFDAFVERIEILKNLSCTDLLHHVFTGLQRQWKRVALYDVNHSYSNELKNLTKIIKKYYLSEPKGSIQKRERIRFFFISYMPHLAKILFKLGE